MSDLISSATSLTYMYLNSLSTSALSSTSATSFESQISSTSSTSSESVEGKGDKPPPPPPPSGETSGVDQMEELYNSLSELGVPEETIQQGAEAVSAWSIENNVEVPTGGYVNIYA